VPGGLRGPGGSHKASFRAPRLGPAPQEAANLAALSPAQPALATLPATHKQPSHLLTQQPQRQFVAPPRKALAPLPEPARIAAPAAAAPVALHSGGCCPNGCWVLLCQDHKDCSVFTDRCGVQCN
jgi:hypothetical protein